MEGQEKRRREWKDGKENLKEL